MRLDPKPGKWHGGMSRKEQLPVNRGFDSSLGYLSGESPWAAFLSATCPQLTNQPTDDRGSAINAPLAQLSISPSLPQCIRLIETQPSRFVRHTRRCEAEFPVPISDAGACVPHTRRGTRVGAGCRPPHRRSLQKNPKKPSPRGIKEIPKHKFFPSASQKSQRAERAHGDERSGAARKRGCAGEEGAKPPDPESRGRSMTRGPRAGHDNGRRDAGPVSHTLCASK